MSYRIAGIDVHKRMLAVVVADVASEGAYEFERRQFGTSPEQLCALAAWLSEQAVEEAVMESTAQYWKPVWEALERNWQPARRGREGAVPNAGKLHLAQAKSNRGARGRKNDFGDAERLIKRLVAQELRLSFVPEVEQRLWRTVTRKKHQLTRQRVRLQSQLECLLEEAHVKLSSIVSDLLGVSGRRILAALAEGEKNPAALAALADRNLRATPQQLCDALSASADLNPVYRRVLKMYLKELELLEEQMTQLDQEIAPLLKEHEDAVQRLAEVPGLGVESAHQIMAEVGSSAAAFPSAKNLSSWVGVCPGEEQSAQVSRSSRSPKGNRTLRGLLNQAAHAAVKTKGSVFEVVFQRLLRGLQYQEAIWAIAHRLCRLIWKILHEGSRYEERGPAVSAKSKRIRAAKMVRELRRLGYSILDPVTIPVATNPA
jgi:transposase